MEIITYSQMGVLPWLPTMHEWCAKRFREYPYLYAPPEDQVISPGDTIYVNERESILIVATKESEVIGIATGISLHSKYLTSCYFTPLVVEKFQEKGFDPSRILYIGYFLLSPEYRDDLKIVNGMYELLAAFAKAAGKKQLSYLDVVRDERHPLKPQNYRPPEPWGYLISGFRDSAVTIQTNTWPTIQADGSILDETPPLQFYIKEI